MYGCSDVFMEMSGIGNSVSYFYTDLATMGILEKIKNNTHFAPPANWLRIKTIDMHTAGEPLRVIVSGFPEIKGNSILEMRDYVRSNYDHLRTALMFEPRGHADMYGCLLTPPVSDDADFGIIFMHNEGYSTMCGHATIAISKLAVELGWVEVKSPVTGIKIDAPCGLLKAYVHIQNNEVESVSFDNVPSFVVSLDNVVEVEGLGRVKYDLAYGGAYYAFTDAAKLQIACIPENYYRLIEAGMKIKHAVMASDTAIVHPYNNELSFLYGTIFIGEPVSKDADSRNVCIFANGEVDRSPTGSGLSARMAIHYKRGEIKLHENRTIESILGTTFECSVQNTVLYGNYDAIIPRIGGTAYITGQHEFLIDPQDPLKTGFILR